MIDKASVAAACELKFPVAALASATALLLPLLIQLNWANHASSFMTRGY